MFISYLLSKTNSSTIGEIDGGLFALMILGMIVLVIWVIVWKGLALWKSARQGQKVWFVILLIVNTMGILEIIYLLLNRKTNIPTDTQNPLPPPADQVQ